MDYLTTGEVSKVWNISPRRIQVLCKEGRVEGAVFKGIWLIPADAKKPEDPRKNKYIIDGNDLDQTNSKRKGDSQNAKIQ